MSFYLKYRPASFDDLVGQDHVKSVLLAQAEQGNFSHNYLLYGPRWTGKTSTARLLWKKVALGKDNNDVLRALIDTWKTLDFVEIDAASHTWVDNIREEIIDKALYPPTQLQKKVYIIDEVHMLSKGAFNALLKIMEEPPEYLMFVLATTEIHKVPDTIISRCQVFNFKRISQQDMVKRLAYIAGEEGIAYEQAGLELIAKIASGALRDAIKYLEQISMLGDVTQTHVSTCLWVVSDAVVQTFMNYILAGQVSEVYSYLDVLYEQWTDLRIFANDILWWIDSNFLENPSLYATIAGVMREIYAEIKQYPYPVLYYKAKLHQYFNEQKVHIPESNPQVQTETSSSDIVSHKDISLEDSSDDITATEKHDNGHDIPETSVSSLPESVSHEWTDFMQDLVESIDKKMIQSIMKKHVMMQSKDDEAIHFVIINKMYHVTMQKAENMQYLEEKIATLTGKSLKIHWTYMSKDDYVLQSLGV